MVLASLCLLALSLQAESYKVQLQRANSEITTLLRDKNKVSGCSQLAASLACGCSCWSVDVADGSTTCANSHTISSHHLRLWWLSHV